MPLRDSYYGHQAVDEAVPLGMVERIEIITGPGSVLYGTNAFAGVVRITTRSAETARNTRNLRVAQGTRATREGTAEFAAGPVLRALIDHLLNIGFLAGPEHRGDAWQHDQDRKRTYGLFKVADPAPKPP